jgi:putative NADH-flavin reductase
VSPFPDLLPERGTGSVPARNQRGHSVTAIVRNRDRGPVQSGVTERQGDVFDRQSLADLLRQGHPGSAC